MCGIGAIPAPVLEGVGGAVPVPVTMSAIKAVVQELVSRTGWTSGKP
jgi:hypothetical protein